MKSAEKQELKAKAHHLRPVILVGAKKLTPGVISETDLALTTHELIKIKINDAERDDRKIIVQELCTQLHAELIQLIGNTAILFRKKPS